MQEPGDDPWHISRYVDTDDVSKRLAETLDLSEQEHEESDADESQASHLPPVFANRKEMQIYTDNNSENSS